ncbi:acetyltransferase [Sphingomonas sp. OTU376]|uniref:acetyltransferase n=1 Tax=Sphingomonas sp. OTU376 TaxID=3043863 RepID=UPI00313C13CA
MTIDLRPSRPEEHEELFEIWSTAVDATHHFISKEDRVEIAEQVRTYLHSARLIVAATAGDVPVGFMDVGDGEIRALFVHASHHGCGIGRELVSHATRMSPSLKVDVNEQNEQAVLFYARLGFKRSGRSPTDGDGRPYPLLHLSLVKEGAEK